MIFDAISLKEPILYVSAWLVNLLQDTNLITSWAWNWYVVLQVLISYIEQLAPQSERQTALQRQYYFTCTCATCADSTRVSVLTLLHGIYQCLHVLSPARFASSLSTVRSMVKPLSKNIPQSNAWLQYPASILALILSTKN